MTLKTAKTAIVAAFALLCLIPAAKAQNFAFGVYFDPQITWLHSDNNKKFDSHGALPTMCVGFDAEKFFATRYSVVSGLAFNIVGGKIIHMDNSIIKSVNSQYDLLPNADVKYRSQYLTIPLGLKFRSNEIGYTTIYASVGAKANIRLKGFTWVDQMSVMPNAEGVHPEVAKEKTPEHFKGFWPAFYVQAGAEQSLGGSSSLQFGLTYTGGLMPIVNADKANGGDAKTTITAHSIGLRIGFIF